jgi:hypothetical protein
MTHRHPSHLLEDYLDGSLSPDEVAYVERQLAEDMSWREELTRLKVMLETLKQVTVPDPGARYFEDLQERVEARTVHTHSYRRSPAPERKPRGSETLRSLISIAFVLSLLFFSLYYSNLNVDRRTQPLSMGQEQPEARPTLEDSLLKSADELDVNFLLLGSPSPIGRLGTFTANRAK